MPLMRVHQQQIPVLHVYPDAIRGEHQDAAFVITLTQAGQRGESRLQIPGILVHARRERVVDGNGGERRSRHHPGGVGALHVLHLDGMPIRDLPFEMMRDLPEIRMQRFPLREMTAGPLCQTAVPVDAARICRPDERRGHRHRVAALAGFLAGSPDDPPRPAGCAPVVGHVRVQRMQDVVDALTLLGLFQDARQVAQQRTSVGHPHECLPAHQDVIVLLTQGIAFELFLDNAICYPSGESQPDHRRSPVPAGTASAPASHAPAHQAGARHPARAPGTRPLLREPPAGQPS
jgi:hypothetical protein